MGINVPWLRGHSKIKVNFETTWPLPAAGNAGTGTYYNDNNNNKVTYRNKKIFFIGRRLHWNMLDCIFTLFLRSGIGNTQKRSTYLYCSLFIWIRFFTVACELQAT